LTRAAEAEGKLRVSLPALGADPEVATGPGISAPIPRAGLGVRFDQGRPEEEEPGGALLDAERLRPLASTRDTETALEEARWRLRFPWESNPVDRARVGDRVWLTGDPQAQRRAKQESLEGYPEGRWPLSISVRGALGSPLVLSGRLPPSWAEGSPIDRQVESSGTLQASTGAGLTDLLLREKLGALGGSPFHLVALDLTGLDAGLHLPVSQLKKLRRTLAQALEEALVAPPLRPLNEGSALERLRIQSTVRRGQDDEVLQSSVSESKLEQALTQQPLLVPLCRTEAQLEAALALGFEEVELDWMELIGLERAVKLARSHGARVVIATVRIQSPGKAGYDRRIERLAPDGVLLRHWGGLMHFARRREALGGLKLHGDFSLNITNSVSAREVIAAGLDSFTVAHDLDAIQLESLLRESSSAHAAVTIHHHIPTFHTEHCVYAHLLSKGRDIRSCGQPCERHGIGLKDQRGRVHPVIVDVECRNTVFNAEAQSAASLLPRLCEAGVQRLRVEFIREGGAETLAVLEGYRSLLAGTLSVETLYQRLGVHEQFGVTSGTMRVLERPLARHASN
ncbi:MAG: DUF3656 domain-containing protein, partial [Myxococcota bacterium]|nr:DUF3656 domain-containing protein [Myxococcota bacterium]